MKICEECGKQLSILEGYKHPTMGKKHLVCSPCFDNVSTSVATWAEFVRVNSFSNEPIPKMDLKMNFKLRNILTKPVSEPNHA